MLYHRILLAIVLGLSSLFRVADANLIDHKIKSSIRTDGRNHDMRSLVEEQGSISAIVQPNFDFADPACTCVCEVEPGTEGVIIRIEGPLGGKVGQVLNLCVPVEYEELIFNLFETFPNLPQPVCVDASDGGCPTDLVIPVPLPDPFPMCECPCELDSPITNKPQTGVIVKASPWLFHLCIPESWSAFFLVVPSIITPILQLPSTDFTCAADDEKKKGCPTKLVIPVNLPPLPDIPELP